MKFYRPTGKRSVAVILTALVIALVLLLNVGCSVLADKVLLFTDLTDVRYRSNTAASPTWISTGIYSPVDETIDYLSGVFASANAEGDEPVRVEILFCADPDMLTANDEMRPIYYTALSLQKEFPESVFVKTTDVWTNPSSVDAYRTNSYSSIYQNNIIISSGSEFRICTMNSFYTYDTATSEEPWAYNGEKVFARAILAVTRAEAPICCFTVNHGEAVATDTGKSEYSVFFSVVESAGYEVRFLDLEKDPIPEKCRLLITLDPQNDFSDNLQNPTDSEIRKLDDFLNATYAYLIFADADTPYLPHLEEYLEEWGIAFGRTEDHKGTYGIKDPGHALDGDGTTFYGTYAVGGQGASLIKDVRENGNSPKVAFKNAVPLVVADTYANTYVLADEENGTEAFTYASHYTNGRLREMFEFFTTGDLAVATAYQNGTAVVDTLSPFRLMTITSEDRTVAEGQGLTTVNESSYVCAVGSVDFVSNAMLSTNAYGNTDVLLSVLRGIGQEILPVGLSFKTLYSPDISDGYSGNPTAVTIILIALPAVICLFTGTFILVRRKTRAGRGGKV